MGRGSRAPRIWLIAGPTASGKSALALRLARETGGEIVNADSMQIYRDLRVLTARPSPEEQALVPHHLFGIADAAEAWSVGRWLKAAREALAAIAERGRPAIVVGGTGLYFRALTGGLAEIPPIPRAVREETCRLLTAIGEVDFRACLAAADPAAEARITNGDRQRLSRALEVFVATGRPLSVWQTATVPAIEAGSWRGVVLAPPVKALYARCEARLCAMVAAGALAEVAALTARGLSPRLPAMKALGVPAFSAQLGGETSLAEALARARGETRRYAKRQATWFRGQAAGWARIEAAEAEEQWRALRTLSSGPG
ncbi:MAG: tRNA (adenosine(37)-N6)-dimethylallyltransferase MiaA [Caulobacteraceae bacterium]